MVQDDLTKCPKVDEVATRFRQIKGKHVHGNYAHGYNICHLSCVSIDPSFRNFTLYRWYRMMYRTVHVLHIIRTYPTYLLTGALRHNEASIWYQKD